MNLTEKEPNELVLLEYDLNALRQNKIKVLSRKRLIKMVERELWCKKHSYHRPIGCLTVEALENELTEVTKLQDFASGAGDADGYSRLCGQFTLLERLIEKAKKSFQKATS